MRPRLSGLIASIAVLSTLACCPCCLAGQKRGGEKDVSSITCSLPPKQSENKRAIPSSTESTILLPEGIADSAGRIGYFSSATGSVEAIDLASGKVLWATHEAQRPLLLDGDHLLAQAGLKRNRLRILRLDLTRKGECDVECDPVVFPAWVVTGVAHGRTFLAHWRLEKRKLLLEWEANAWYDGKSRPTPEQALAARKHAAGFVQIDLRTGQIEILPSERRKILPEPPLPEHYEKKALRWQGLVGSRCKVLALEEENGQQRLILHSWDRQTEKEQEAKELMRGKHLLARASLDERVLCLHEACPSPEERASLMPKNEPNWLWLFSVQTGESLGRIPDEAGIHDVAVLGKQVFYLVPGALHGALNQPSMQARTLKVIDLNSGKKLWEHPVAGRLICPPPL